MSPKSDLSRFFHQPRIMDNCKSCGTHADREELTDRGLCPECEYYDTAGKIAEAYQIREADPCL